MPNLRTANYPFIIARNALDRNQKSVRIVDM
jgi:hypothetical protein